MNASSVSAALRRGGLLPVTSSNRGREGLRVTSSLGGVRVHADVDAPSVAKTLSGEAEAVLLERGYVVDRLDAETMYVTKAGTADADVSLRRIADRIAADGHQPPSLSAIERVLTAVEALAAEDAS